MAITFQKAVKYQSKLRLALAGPSGSGKSYTSLLLAPGLAEGGTVAVIDTERGSMSKYADIIPGFEFDVLELDHYHPDRYIEAIKTAEQVGYAVLVIDSLSHAWNGPGGLLEIVENITKRSKSGNSFQSWNEATPIQNRLIDTITRSRLHIIATMRTKTEYVIETNERGRSVPRKVGLAPVQRGDVEYEFDIYADMSLDNEMLIQKSRCPQLSGQVIAKPDGKVADILKSWLSGEPAPPKALTVKEVYDQCVSASACTSKESFYEFASATLGFLISKDNVTNLNQEQLTQIRNAADEERPF